MASCKWLKVARSVGTGSGWRTASRCCATGSPTLVSVASCCSFDLELDCHGRAWLISAHLLDPGINEPHCGQTRWGSCLTSMSVQRLMIRTSTYAGLEQVMRLAESCGLSGIVRERLNVPTDKGANAGSPRSWRAWWPARPTRWCSWPGRCTPGMIPVDHRAVWGSIGRGCPGFEVSAAGSLGGVLRVAHDREAVALLVEVFGGSGMSPRTACGIACRWRMRGWCGSHSEGLQGQPLMKRRVM